MKLKLLLADDDIEMLQAMNHMLKSGPENYEVVGLAEDGAQAFELLGQTRPDILITDITMPQMDGLELIAAGKKLLPDLKTVLITCHEDFRYAKEAIQLMVDEYLVKYTLTGEELLGCLEQLRQRLELQHTKRSSFDQISSEIYRNKEQFKEKYISALAKGLPVDELCQKASLYDVVFPQGEQVITALFVDNFAMALKNSIIKDDGDLLLFSLMNIISDVLFDLPVFLFLYKGQIFFLLPKESVQQSDFALAERLRQIMSHAGDILNVLPTAVVMEEPFCLSDIGQALEKLQEARSNYFYQAGGEIIQAGKGAASFAPDRRHDDWIEQFKQAIFQPEQLEAVFLSIQHDLMEQKYTPQHAKDVLEGLNLVLDTALRSHGRKLPQMAVTGDTFAGCAAQVRENMGLWLTYMAKNKGVTFSQDIQETVQYMTDHLDSDISLEKVASVIYKNSSYLSRLFKRETGLTFTDYLTQMRIEKATWLLSETAMSVKDIGESIGIFNTQYFYKFFKRETGKRPGDLRKGRI